MTDKSISISIYNRQLFRGYITIYGTCMNMKYTIEIFNYNYGGERIESRADKEFIHHLN